MGVALACIFTPFLAYSQWHPWVVEECMVSHLPRLPIVEGRSLPHNLQGIQCLEFQDRLTMRTHQSFLLRRTGTSLDPSCFLW